MNKYPINEIFYSLQGEGYHAGTSAVFIRFSGCNIKCPFCDTQHQSREMLTAEEIIAKAKEAGANAPLVVLTGGEPTLYLDAELYDMLIHYFPKIAIETNGTRPIYGGCFTTISPKEDFVPGAKVIHTAANEVKVVYDGVHNPEKWHREIEAGYYYLQPCDTGDTEMNQRIMTECVEYIKAHPWWKLSLQTQKILNIR